MTTLVNNLSPAETMQLSMDYMSAPTLFDEIRRFYGKHIDEIENFSKHVGDIQKSDQQQYQRRLYLEGLQEKIGPQSDKAPFFVDMDTVDKPERKLANIAVGAVFREVTDRKLELSSQLDELNNEGESITRAWVDNMRARAPLETKVCINGTTYDWLEYDSLVSRVIEYRERIVNGRIERASMKPKLTIYGGRETFLKFCTKYNYNILDTGTAEAKVRLVAPDDWEALVCNLIAVTKF